MIFDRTNVELNVQSIKTKELCVARFEPIYYSVSDGWVEDYTRAGKNDNPIQLMDFINDIEDNWPGEGENLKEAKLYFANAMEWSIRFVSYKTPIVALSHEEDLPNAY